MLVETGDVENAKPFTAEIMYQLNQQDHG